MKEKKDTSSRHIDSIPRRDLLIGAAGVVGLFCLAAYTKAQGSGPFVRPPGALDEASFLALCLKCDRCRSICHTHVVSIGQLRDGLAAMRTPILDFHHGYCDFCKKCIEVCPTGALQDFSKETITIGTAELTETCIALRTGACTKCYEECPYDAITLDEQQRPIIDPIKCNGCGMCEYICPANIFQANLNRQYRGIVVKHSDHTGVEK